VAILLALSSFLPVQSYALALVPDGLPATQNAAFKRRYSQLAQLKVTLNSQIDLFMAKCRSVPENSPMVDQCREEEAGLEVAKGHYKKDADAYEHELAAAIETELAVINNRIPQSRKALERLTPQLRGFQASLDEWTTLADDARIKARKTALETVASVLLEKLSMRHAEETQLNEESLKRINRLLRKRVFMDDLYRQVLTVEKLESLKTGGAVIELLKNVDRTLTLAGAVQSRDREEVLKTILMGIEIVNKDPRISLLIADGELTIDAAYGWLAHKEARDRLNQLLNLGEEQFKAVNELTALYKRDIDNRKRLLAAHPD